MAPPEERRGGRPPAAGPAAVEIGPRDLAGWRAAGVPHAVLDVREPWETAICGFEDAIRVPLGVLLADGGGDGAGATAQGGGAGAIVARLPRDRPLVVVCHHGRRSLVATLHLRGRGFADAVNLAGGVDGWAATVDPSMPRY